jgi:hypothetical protein
VPSAWVSLPRSPPISSPLMFTFSEPISSQIHSAVQECGD